MSVLSFRFTCSQHTCIVSFTVRTLTVRFELLDINAFVTYIYLFCFAVVMLKPSLDTCNWCWLYTYLVCLQLSSLCRQNRLQPRLQTSNNQRGIVWTSFRQSRSWESAIPTTFGKEKNHQAGRQERS
jgi:hypothetical protein